jgi:hypothetical protein
MNDMTTAPKLAAFSPDPEQREVIEGGPEERMLVVAGPGSGKTQVAAMRLVRLLRAGLQPAQILVLSFSRSAVATLTKRIAGLEIEDPSLLEDLRHLAIRTFDSWAFRVLRQGGASPAELLSRTHDANISAVTRQLEDPDGDVSARVTGIRHVIVDEFQDLPGVRAEMVAALLSRLDALAGAKVGFTVLGDPVQAIFRFACRHEGAPPPIDPWLPLRQRLGETLREVVLKNNHRATAELAKKAAILRKILSSDALDASRKLAGIREYLRQLPSSRDEKRIGSDWLGQLPDGSLAVLTRTNGEALQVWKMLVGKELEGPAVPVHLKLAGGVQTAPAWIAALLARYRHPTMTQLVFDKAYPSVVRSIGAQGVEAVGLPDIEVAWTRLLRASGAPDSSTTLELEPLRARLDWPDAFPDDQAAEAGRVFITTVHQSKGMEFDYVALLDEQEQRSNGTPEDPLEEAHVAFVALTRAALHVGRLPAKSIYNPLFKWNFEGGRSRQVQFGNMFDFQIGIAGDLDPVSFVNADVHKADKAVEDLQAQLLEGATKLRGRKVVLRKTDGPARDARYEVRLQEEGGNGEQDGLLIGRTTWQVTKDLLDFLWNRGYSLPWTLYNLRIDHVVTIGADAELPPSVPDPWRSSGFWLGISLIGTGDFKPKRRNGN